MKVYKTAARILGLLLDDACFLWVLFANSITKIGSRIETRDKCVILFGPPIISLRYVAKAIIEAGYEAVTVVPSVYHINNVDDFDFVSPSRLDRFRKILSGGTWVIFFDSFNLMFGFLRYCPKFVKWISGVRLIVMPYGADAFQYSLLSDTVLRHALMIDYPHNTTTEDRISRNVRAFSNCADVIIGCLGHIGNLYRWDALPVHYYPVDIARIDALKSGVEKCHKFTIIHSPNHRGVKGTELILRAVEQLQSEGFEIELRLLQGRKNDEVIKNLHSAHLLIDQVIGGGYALSAMEGMACGLPVISHLSENMCDLFRVYSHLNECPILSCDRTVESIKKKILEGMDNYVNLSNSSRSYVTKFHSVKASSYFWGAVLDGDARVKLMTFYSQNVFNA